MGEFINPIENEKPRVRLSELLQRYFAGDSHGHSIFSNPSTRHEADYSYEQIFSYLQETIDKGTGKAEYIVLAEHPSDAGNPEMVDGKLLLEHHQEVHNFTNQQLEKGIKSPHLISGVETDIISPDGQVNVPDEVLAQMDMVIASKHDLRKVFPENNGNPNAEELTKMYLGLMDNENVDVIGHPNRYVSYETLDKMDWESLLSKAKETNTALEVNLNAPMPKPLIEKVIKAGVPIFIGTDIHTLEQFQKLPEDVQSQIETTDDRLQYGPGYKYWIKIARMLKTLDELDTPPEQVITSSYDRLNNWLSKEKPERKIEFENET